MDCKQAQQQLYQEARSLALWLHLALCGKCRAEARALRHLERAISAAPRPEPPADLLTNLMAITQEEPGPVLGKDHRSRLVFWLVWAVIAALLALSFAVTYTVTKRERVNKPERSAPMIDVAPIPDLISSIYIKLPNDPQIELWNTPTTLCRRATDPSGQLLFSIIIEPDSNRWRLYRRDRNTLYVMDLKRVKTGAADLVARDFADLLQKARKRKTDNHHKQVTILYNTPRPAWVDDLPVPPGTMTVVAKAKICKRNYRGIKHIFLEAWVGNTQIEGDGSPIEDKKGP